MKTAKYTLLILLINVIFIQNISSQIIGQVNTDKIRYKINTVVYIEYVDGEFPPPKKNPLINQIGLTFIPHILPIVVGTTVDFLNSDDVLHNVFSPDSCSDKFNLGTWPKNETKTHKYEKLGCEAVLLCNVHPEMEAYVIVLQNTYFAVTDIEGNFHIENLPAGDYTLKVWNKKLKAKDKQITVPQSGTIQVEFELTK